MKKKTKIIKAIIISLILICGIIVYPSIYDYQCKNRTYSELEADLENVFSSNISVITVTKHDDITSYSAGASGVVFDKIDGRYYALTAYHVVADEDTYLIRTTYDASLGQYKNKHSGNGRSSIDDYYSRLAKAKVEYTCEESDLAIISFESKEELFDVLISEELPAKKDKIATVGVLEGKPFEITYGVITSGKLFTFHTDDGEGDNNVLKHNAYVAPGSSGGTVFNHNMKLVGINIGGGTDLFGRFRYGVMIPCDQIQQCINDWKSRQSGG